MMEIPTLKGKQRKASGSREAARLRKAGKLPGIVYGHKLDPVPVTFEYPDVGLLLEHGEHVVNLDVEGKVEPCLFKDAQYDHLGAKLIHVDLARVDLTERVQVHVEVELRGSPKGVAEGGVLRKGLKSLFVDCLVTNIPKTIRLDVSELGVDDVMHVKDLTLESGLKAMDDPEAVVVMVREPTVKADEELEAAGAASAEGAEGAAASTAAEPEVIAKGKDEEESGSAAK